MTYDQDSPWLPGEEQPVGHGSYFYYAHKEGLLAADNANIVSLTTTACNVVTDTTPAARWHPEPDRQLAEVQGRLRGRLRDLARVRH